jgi:phage/plasmid-like protein (TIGR03299 family)
MSQESLEWLNQNTLQGYTVKRGEAWHYAADAQGDEPNHYPDAIPVADVIRRLFNWEPVEGKVKTTFRAGGRSQTVEVPGRKSLVHPTTGEVFSIVGKGFAVHSYRQWLVDNFKIILDKGDDELGIGSAGLLKGGGQAWVQLELPESVEGPGGIVHRPYLTGSAVLDATRSTSYSTGSQLAVCDNTLSAALAGASSMIKYQHRASVEMRPQEVRDALELLIGSADAINAELEALLAVTVSDSQWEKFVTAHIGKDRPFDAGRGQTNWDTAHDELTALYKTSPMVAPWTGTAFGALQAVNTWRHHNQVAKGVQGGRAERNLISRVDGTNDKADLATLAKLELVLAS